MGVGSMADAPLDHGRCPGNQGRWPKSQNSKIWYQFCGAKNRQIRYIKSVLATPRTWVLDSRFQSTHVGGGGTEKRQSR